MDPVDLNNDDNSTEEPSIDELILPSTPEICGISGDQQVSTRVGDEYQAEIPPLIPEPEKSQLLLQSCDSEGIFDGYHFFMGLPMPVTWIHNKKTSTEDEGSRSDNSGNSPDTNASTNSRTCEKNDPLENGAKPNAEEQDIVMDLVPGSLHHSWSDAEVDSFILGLYLFGKNFVKIKRFLSTKEMGDILSFYYGEFYGSEGYHRWSDRQRVRRKKCIYGRKLFTGWRKDELLSRLHPHVPEHSQSFLLEVSTAFSEGKVSLENYVCKLKTIVGIEALVDAIGIGNVKTDLTSLSTEPGKSNPLLAVCPTRKSCSSLTCSDITKLLTGGFRLSKARCSDIFWEAVWPRLLARGWHSEQPRNQNFLVFLIPGVKKFSKRKLKKGKQYFDSVSDVLSKVASEPKLIELEGEEARVDSNEEENCDPSNRQTYQYLKPRVPSLKLMKFTVVDSSLVDGGKVCKMREMRFLPNLLNGIEMKHLDNSESNNGRIKVDKADRCEKKSGEFNSNRTQFTIVDTSLRNAENSLKVRELRFVPRIKGTSETKISSRKKKSKLVIEEKSTYKSSHSKDTSDSDDEPLVYRKILNKFLVSSDNHSARTIKTQCSKRSKSGNSNNLVPVVKRRKLTACSNSDLSRVINSFSTSHGSKREGLSSCALNSPVKRNSNPPRKPSSSTTMCGEVIEESSRNMSGTPCLGVETSHEENVRHQTQSQVELDLGNEELESVDMKSSQEASTKYKCHLLNPDDPNPEALRASAEESTVNPIRQSKRSRPLTTRALEALEYGFISMKRQRSMPVHRKRKGPSNGGAAEFTVLEERVADGHLEKKDLVDEVPGNSSADHNLVKTEL